MLDLEITPTYRKEIISLLKVEDYSQGPLDEKYTAYCLCGFSAKIKQKEVYIKISMGTENNNAICISFHISEHPMNYPFKNKQK